MKAAAVTCRGFLFLHILSKSHAKHSCNPTRSSGYFVCLLFGTVEKFRSRYACLLAQVCSKAFCRLHAENGRNSQAHRLGLVARNMIRLRTCHTRNNDDLDLFVCHSQALEVPDQFHRERKCFYRQTNATTRLEPLEQCSEFSFFS
ncbi:hypothetical protein DMN98_09875 [Vibrio parahaemolyticus]|nr:hypothetical protein [Vibrio parahaemolyticus]